MTPLQGTFQGINQIRMYCDPFNLDIIEDLFTSKPQSLLASLEHAPAQISQRGHLPHTRACLLCLPSLPSLRENWHHKASVLEIFKHAQDNPSTM